MSLFAPDLYYRDVFAIELDALADRGVEFLLVDLDNTLLPRDTNVVTDRHREWALAVAARGFGVCLVSNNWHDRVNRVADELGFQLVSKAVKPLPFAFLRALSLLDAKRRQTAVVGDQVFTDVLGGNTLGMLTVLVQPISGADLPHTLLLRRLEQRILAGRAPLP
ncbi:MAG: YqeG family HAD IIIA-type phosphatase [Coriobacteriia bacterium]|nr:YqeG family HAD IIIA-type phosphatase [Coriobacteriia bacterium]